jgi:hypothetical protein
MAREFEIIGAGAIGALLHRKATHGPAPGAICANCGAELGGPYCHICGQDADDHHRSIAHLAWEGVEGLTHLDGRLAQTLPLLLFRPGKLARDHLEGRRARHVPPFRLFLISLLVFMLVLETLFHQATIKGAHPTGGGTAIASAQMGDSKVVFATPKQARAMIKAQAGGAPTTATASAKPGADIDIRDDSGRPSASGVWLRDHIKRAVANKDYYTMVLFTWAHRLAILLLPILAGLLALVYVRRRRFFVYDHLIVAMQFLSFEFLIFAVAWLIPDPVRGWALLVATLWTPVNLYMTLRGAYGSRIITAGIKTLFLWFSTLFLFAVLMAGLMTLALAEM